MRAEGGAEYWHYFGFLAPSDFDCARETLGYLDEEIRRQREHKASSLYQRACGSTDRAPGLVGAGWDEQNGPFTADAVLPQVSARSTTGATSTFSNALPLRLTFRYEGRGTYELMAFLAESAGNEERGSPMLYGVWATAPSQHKHLF